MNKTNKLEQFSTTASGVYSAEACTLQHYIATVRMCSCFHHVAAADLVGNLALATDLWMAPALFSFFFTRLQLTLVSFHMGYTVSCAIGGVWITAVTFIAIQ